jgi:hypothetical protein
MYTLILTNFYNYAPESVLKDGMDPLENIMREIQIAEMAIYDICEAANNALGGGFFMEALTSDPTWAKNLALSKLFLFVMLILI